MWFSESQEYKKFYQEYSLISTDKTDKEESERQVLFHVTMASSADWWREPFQGSYKDNCIGVCFRKQWVGSEDTIS